MLVRGLVVIATVALAIVIIRESSLATSVDDLKAWVDGEVHGHGLSGGLLFIAAGALFTAVGLSRQVIAFIGGYAFGVGLGTGLALVAGLGGVIAAFSYARFLGRDVVSARFPARIRRLDEFLQVNPFLTTLAVRLLPISNNLVVNLTAGITNVPAVPFFAASAVGHLPQTLVFALIGSGLAQGIYLKTAVAIVLFLVSVAIGTVLFRRFRRDARQAASVEALLDQAEAKAAEIAR
ncbi:MAG: VTT domain-containing protein [Alphaproteobacteria bacterium]|nr:VTT domain-containing protein [Alphaproteobacteria bacterium]